MTAIKVATTTKVPVKYLRARCGVRYWEDGTVNGERDEDGSRIPCRKDDDWCPKSLRHLAKLEDAMRAVSRRRAKGRAVA